MTNIGIHYYHGKGTARTNVSFDLFFYNFLSMRFDSPFTVVVMDAICAFAKVILLCSFQQKAKCTISVHPQSRVYCDATHSNTYTVYGTHRVRVYRFNQFLFYSFPHMAQWHMGDNVCRVFFLKHSSCELCTQGLSCCL